MKLSTAKKYKITAVKNYDSPLLPNRLFKSIRGFYGLWMNFEHMQENSYENECSLYDLIIYEDDQYGYEEGDLIHTYNIPFEHVKTIDKEYSDQKWYEWLICVEDNDNQYKPCEVKGKIVATTNYDLAVKHGLEHISNYAEQEFSKLQGNVEVEYFIDGFHFLPNEYINSGKFIQYTDKSDRLDLSRDEHEILNKVHMSLGWDNDEKGYNIVLKNRNGKQGKIYTEADIRAIKEKAFQEGVESVQIKAEN